jgi:dynein light intermediate chain
MLVRVRDELRMVVSTFNRLYESAIAFGMRKALQADQRKSDMINKVKELEQTCTDLEKEIETLNIQMENNEKKDEDDKRKDEKNHFDKVQSYKDNLNGYKKQTDDLLETPIKNAT